MQFHHLKYFGTKFVGQNICMIVVLLLSLTTVKEYFDQIIINRNDVFMGFKSLEIDGWNI